MSKIIGMSRNIKFEWLNETAKLVSEGYDEKEIKDLLNDYLSIVITSPINLRKTREILMNIWVRNNEKNIKIKELALELFSTQKKSNKLLAHWCMILTSYPVFMDIVKVIGKMDDKQFDITTAQLKSRMFDVWGERTTLYHSIDKNIRTLKDLDVLKNIKIGVYEVKKYNIEDDRAKILLIMTLLNLKESLYLKIDELKNAKEFYPFKYNFNLNILHESGVFSFDKFGDEVVISKF